jgi:hypothetical protein
MEVFRPSVRFEAEPVVFVIEEDPRDRLRQFATSIRRPVEDRPRPSSPTTLAEHLFDPAVTRRRCRGDLRGPRLTAVTERETYLAAARSFADLVARIPAPAYGGPGLGEWDLRALVGHASRSLVTVLEYLDRPAGEGVAPLEDPAAYFVAIAATLGDPAQAGAVVERGRAAGAALGDDPAARVSALVEEVGAALARHDDDHVLPTIAAPMRLRDYLPTRTFELVVHALDVGRATGLPAGLGEAPTAEAAVVAARVAVRTGRGADLLLALTGRAGLPTGFSVV